MADIPPFSPGCFGSALAYQDDHAVCQGCVFQAQCKPVHEENIQALRERFGITKPAKQASIRKKIAGDGELTLPKKVQEIVDRLDQSALNVVGKLQAGENPFEPTNLNFLKVACHLLVRMNKPLGRPFLAAALMVKLGWQQETADAHARMAFQVLSHVGAVDEREGSISIRKS